VESFLGYQIVILLPKEKIKKLKKGFYKRRILKAVSNKINGIFRMHIKKEFWESK
jgi:hypothetical protein